MIKGMTISDAAHRWVSEMNAYPQDMIRVLMDAKPLDWREITAVGPGQRVYVYNLPEENPDGEPYRSSEHFGEITDCFDHDTYRVSMDDGESILVKEDDFGRAYDEGLPMWGWM